MGKILIILTLLLPRPVHADEDVPRRLTLRHNGVDGVWFRADVAERLLHDMQAAKLNTDLGELYTRRSALVDAELEAARRLFALAEQGEQRSTDALDRALFRIAELESERDVWYRSPAVWLTAGVVLSCLATASVAYAVTQ
jgi:hypothetical protein